MSNNSDKTLDDLFAALRSDSPEPRQNELAELLSNAPVPVGPVGSPDTTNKRPKGRTIMNISIIATLAAGLAYFGLQYGSTPETTGGTPPRIPATTETTTLADTTAQAVTATSPDQSETTRTSHETRIKLYPFTRANILDVKPIEMNDAQLASLGIVRRSDGAILLAEDERTRTIFPADSLASLGAYLPTEKPVLPLPPFELYPTFVTDVQGNLLMMAEHIRQNGGTVTSHTFVGHEPSERALPKYLAMEWMTVSDARVDSSVVPPVKSSRYRLAVGVTTLDTILSAPYTPDGEQVLMNTAKQAMHRLRYRDSLLKQSFGGDEALKLRYAAAIAGERSAFGAAERAMLDTIDHAASAKSSDVEKLQLRIERMHAICANGKLPDSTRLKFERVVFPLEYQHYLLQRAEDAKKFSRINELIPVLVRPATGPLPNQSLDNGLIFWYAPQPALAQAMPREGYELSSGVREQNRTVKNLSVYPNPASMYVFASGSVTAAGTVELELRDLLGHPVMPALRSSVTNGSLAAQIDVTKIAAGLYILVVRTADGSETASRVVIQR